MIGSLRRHDDYMGLIDIAWLVLPWRDHLCRWLRHAGTSRIELLNGDFYCIRCGKTVSHG